MMNNSTICCNMDAQGLLASLVSIFLQKSPIMWPHVSMFTFSTGGLPIGREGGGGSAIDEVIRVSIANVSLAMSIEENISIDVGLLQVTNLFWWTTVIA